MSYMPFLGGRRICLGKTFAEVNSRIVGPAIFGQFDFEFVDPGDKLKKKAFNLNLQKEPEVYLKVKLAPDF